ncbi:MAG: signal peptidase [Gemmataceae bacterium]|nr:signal peptidase [Gemmataceae bacterium]
MEQNAPASSERRYIVRHGAMRFLGDFGVEHPAAVYRRADHVIVQTPRGHEVGEVLCPSSPAAVAAIPEPTTGQILRCLTDADRQRIEAIRADKSRQFDRAASHIAALHLPMQLVDVETLFGGERIIFYFLAENRVDFRELVKVLAREFQTRIELRQIGVRDEAKLLADYGDCGKPVCCNTHMVAMPPVSMRMAKLQKATLDPAKISGRCGRLKCCLRFENEVYEEFQAELPPVNSQILTRKGRGRVLSQEILARKVLVEFEDGRRLAVAQDEILTRL